LYGLKAHLILTQFPFPDFSETHSHHLCRTCLRMSTSERKMYLNINNNKHTRVQSKSLYSIGFYSFQSAISVWHKTYFLAV
jgi:trans-aconitate methyltransferase